MISYDPPYNDVYMNMNIHPADQIPLMTDYATAFLNLMGELDNLLILAIPYEELAHSVASTLSYDGFICVTEAKDALFLALKRSDARFVLQCFRGSKEMVLLSEAAEKDRKKIDPKDIPTYARIVIMTRFGMAFAMRLINAEIIKPDLPNMIFQLTAAIILADKDVLIEPDGDGYKLLFCCNKESLILTLDTVTDDQRIKLSSGRIH